MSEHLTHIAVYEDCARIILNTDKFSQAFKACIRDHYDSGLFTSGTRGNHLFAIPILEKYKDRWEEVSTDPEACQQIAGSIGWITHRAADHQMKPTWRAKEAEDPDFPDTEMQVYHDSVTFREVYSGGSVSTESPLEQLNPHTLEKGLRSLKAAEELDEQKLEELITILYQKQFVELHTFHKTQADINQWMEEFIEYHQEFTEDLRMYIEAYQNPDPGKMEIYIHGINFYEPDDPIIQWVRRVQRRQDPSSINLDEALVADESISHYAKALQRGFRYLSAADGYFQNRISKDECYDVLEILGDNRL